jgi:signal transduction histidine kinase
MERMPTSPAPRSRAELPVHLEQLLRDEKLDALAEFAAAASHEFNNPLSVIYGRAQLLLADERDPERRRALLTIAIQATRIHEMLADLMLFARPPEPQPVPLELRDVVKRAAESYRHLADRQATALELSATDAPTSVSADPVQMQVLVGALIQNALEAVGRGGHVEVAVQRRSRTAQNAEPLPPQRIDPAPPPEHVVLRVRDTGPGLTDSERRHLFDPLYSGREAGRGMGLGLAKCWQIVQNHAATIDVDSTPDRGTAIAVSFPALPSPIASHPHQPHTTHTLTPEP